MISIFVCFRDLHVLAPFKSAVKNVVKKEKIVGGLLASTKPKKGGKNEKNGNDKKIYKKEKNILQKS